ncbi:MAG: leucyl aminopeptidase [Pseudomonadales bacterium]|nr:leucyl aminopeptidase [Pseudomonadales bacterium]
MDFAVTTTSPLKSNTECLLIPVYDNAPLTGVAEEVDALSGNWIQQLLKQGDINPKHAHHLLLPNTIDGIKAKRLLFFGLGKRENMTARSFRADMRHIARVLKQKKIPRATLCLNDEGIDLKTQAHHCCEIFSTVFHHVGELKTRHNNKPHTLKLSISARSKSSQKNIQHGIATGKANGLGINTARRLGDLPGNICTPAFLANQAKALSRTNKMISTTVLDEAKMKSLKMNALLSVSAGSKQAAKLIIMSYQGAAKSDKPVVLVGKGITFDTGGISIKPGAAMDEMKFDMCGAASVIGCMTALTELKPRINVIGIIAAAENMPSGQATKPGDIVTSMSGQTIEILNTDAEGRLVLCDALTYAERFQPETVIDIATLTGACVIALGNHAHGLYSNQDKLANELLQAGQAAEDKAWHMPLWDEYQKQLDSNFADIANIGGRNAGSVTAACFLSRFTKKYPWAHLDIAGTAWNSGAEKGATGRPVGLLMHYLLQKAGFQ